MEETVINSLSLVSISNITPIHIDVLNILYERLSLHGQIALKFGILIFFVVPVTEMMVMMYRRACVNIIQTLIIKTAFGVKKVHKLPKRDLTASLNQSQPK